MAIPSGEIYLLKNVPLTASYEHTIDFKDKDEQFNYFMNFSKYVFDRYTYIRKEREYITVELPIRLTDDINYMLFRSADEERLFYAFVGNKRFINQDVTELTFEVDVFQTYMFDYTFNASYIYQAHIDRWTAEHKPIYSKTDEGLAYGTEYIVESAFKVEQSDNIRWLLVSLKDYSAIVESGYVSEGGTVNPAPSPFACMLVPLVLKTDSINTPYTVKINMYGYSGTIADYNDLISLMNSSAFGDYIQSINLLTYNPFLYYDFVDDTTITVQWKSNALTYTTVIGGKTFIVLKNASISLLQAGNTLAQTDWDNGIENSLPTTEQWEEVKANPYTTKRDKRFESKLLCAPYRYNLLADWRNNSVIVKNEYLPTDYITLKFAFALSYNAPFRFWVKDYKKDPQGRNASLSQAMGLEFPVISDAYYSYMLQNKNTIQTNITNGMINAGVGIINGAMSKGVGGAVGGAISGAVNVATQVRSENAKQADLKAVPDTVINSVDSSFNVIDNNAVVTFYRMAICCENEEILAEIFNMSGYKVNRVEVPNLRSRTRFNYIQTIGANITGSFSQTDLMRLKDIFNNGVTIWHYNEVEFKPLDYTYENIEVNLI